MGLLIHLVFFSQSYIDFLEFSVDFFGECQLLGLSLLDKSVVDEVVHIDLDLGLHHPARVSADHVHQPTGSEFSGVALILFHSP